MNGRQHLRLPGLFFVACVVLPGCAIVEHVGISFLYTEAKLPPNQIVRDVSYHRGAASATHQLDLFMPEGQHWPVLIFVHGGGWTSGDKGLTVGAADVYGNIGRFYASRGIGVAVINYRLLPEVGWREQIEDVADAVAWVSSHITEYGGDNQRLFLSGHSAGAQLATRVALDSDPLRRRGLSASVICGVVAVSGAGLDLTDRRTYELGEDIAYYEKRFRDGGTDDSWQQAASPVSFTRHSAPPFLIIYAGGEGAGLQRQSYRLREALSGAGVMSTVTVVPGQSHERIVLTLSRSDKVAGPAILDFVHNTACPSR
jgi:acetyl esterase/lipase